MTPLDYYIDNAGRNPKRAIFGIGYLCGMFFGLVCGVIIGVMLYHGKEKVPQFKKLVHTITLEK
jgi:uncharacterized membrane protein YsdA (DUF1294 family)